MKKLLIPAVLTATVMIAGFFAFIPIEEATTVHNTITTDIGTSFRISSGSTALGDEDVGNEVFSITCALACIVESIEIWTTGGDEDGDVIHIVNVSGNVDILANDLGVPANNAQGDLAIGTAGGNPGQVHEALRTIGSLAGGSVNELTPLTITASAGNTVSVDLDNPTDTDGDRSVVVIFVGRILGNTVPSVDFAGG